MPDYRVGDEITVKVKRWVWPPWGEGTERSCVLGVWAKQGELDLARVFDTWNDHADGRQRVRVFWSDEVWPRGKWFIVGDDVRPQSAVTALGDLVR